MATDLPAVVIDCGTGLTKCGVAGADEPTVVFPTVVGSSGSTIDVGKPVYDALDNYTVSHPMERGQITNLEDMNKIWQQAFDVLNIDPAGRAVILADSPTNPRETREKMTQQMFETFKAGAVYIANQSVLSLYASGRVTGLVLDCGHGVTHTVPIYEGYALKDSIMKMELGGNDLANYVAKLLTGQGHSFSSHGVEVRETQRITETMCSVAMTYSDRPSSDTEFQLPDGQKLALSPEMVHCTELLYQPSMASVNSPGVHGLVQACIQACEIDMRADLYKNVIMTGGSTLFPGFQERMAYELTALHTVGVRVVAPQKREFYTWIGGSVLAVMEDFSKQLITKKDYEESGPSIVHTKCA